jgi:UDP-glucose-4-epimerase GalE
MENRAIDGVIHFAASAYVGESVQRPDFYYENNVSGTLSLLKAMVAARVGKIAVSSTCAVYGQPDRLPITEATALEPINPYGASKAMMERMCRDFGSAYGLRTVALRYFNACGSEPDLEVGERHDPEPHIIPRIFMAADGKIGQFDVYGTDYATPDGTCIRDYIHVQDLAIAHQKAIDYLIAGGETFSCNLGTGRGLSVKQMVNSAKRVTNRDIPVNYKPRRPGDPDQLVADPSLAGEKLGWIAEHSDIEQIMSSAWRWYKLEKQRLRS